jgi:hypothetical protein
MHMFRMSWIPILAVYTATSVLSSPLHNHQQQQTYLNPILDSRVQEVDCGVINLTIFCPFFCIQ